MKYTVSTRKRSDTWSYQIFIDGSYYSSKSGFKTKMDAKKAGDKAAVKIKTPTKSKDTFKDVALLYIKDGNKEPATIDTYDNWLKVFEPIHAIELIKLTYRDVAPLIQEYSLTHKYNGSQSILRFGKSVVEFAINKLDYDMKNPFNKVTIEKKSGNAKKEHQILTLAEQRELFDKIDNPEIRFLVMAMALAGLRVSEARGLRFESFKGDKLHVDFQRQKIKGKITLKEVLKSHNSKRVIPLHPDLKNELKKLPTNIDSKALIVEKFYAAQTLIAKYKTLGYKITNHSLRHSYATVVIQNGIDFKTLSVILGDNVQTVMSTYSHVNTDMMAHAQNILTNL